MYNSGKMAKWFNHFRKQFGNFPKKLTMHLLCDLAIPFLGIDPREMKACVCTKGCT